MHSRLIIVAGPSGSGKNSIVEALLRRFPDSTRLVTTTSRQIRPGEEEGKDYFFISREEFEKGIKEGRFLEYNDFCGNYYGSSKDVLDKALQNFSYVFGIIDVNGIEALRPQVPAMFVIFLNPGSPEDIRRRLIRTRPGITEENIGRRLKTAEHEMALAHGFDVVIDNFEGGLEKAVETAVSAIAE